MKRLITWVKLIMIILLPNLHPFQQEIATPLPSRLIFYSDSSDFSNDLFFVDPQSLDIKTLLHFDLRQNLQDVKWSPDGEYFAVVQRIAPEQSRITIYTATGDEIKHIDVQLWKPDFYRFPINWNTNDTSISVLFETEDNVPQVGILDIEADPIQVDQTITLATNQLERIYWSANGKLLAYQVPIPEPANISSAIPQPQPLQLYLLDLERRETQLVAEQSFDNCVTWTSNGDQLGIVSEMARNPETEALQVNALLIMDATGQVIEEIHPYRYESHIVLGCPFVWSHDETMLAFSSQYFDAGTVKGGLFVAQTDSGEAKRLTDTPYAVINATWSPDDTHLAIDTLYSAFRDVRVISLDGWQHTFTREGITFFNSSWRPRDLTRLTP